MPSILPDTIEFNPRFSLAWQLMEKTDKNIFVTGRAGTGKSTLLAYFASATLKKTVILAPTGVAALNVGGQTIHSFFRFKPDVTLEKVRKISKKNSSQGTIYQKLETIIIDEISMVRADLLDCVDKFLRLNRGCERPFGGAQMIFIGDLYQLPPVVTGPEREIFRTHYESSYFFSARVFQSLDLEMVELDKIYRQKDPEFIRLLNAIRNRSAGEADLAALNRRVHPGDGPKQVPYSVCLTPTNQAARQRNEEFLLKLAGDFSQYAGLLEGDFPNQSLPTDLNLRVKKGAQVMLLNNDAMGRWVNGTLGKIVDIEKEEEPDVLRVQLENGALENIVPHRWDLYHYRFNQEKNRIETEIVGSFTQYPLKLAWALTIHKSQGKTFEHVILDIGHGTFAHGQLYVALSRCTSLAGLVLAKPLRRHHILLDGDVVRFMTRSCRRSEDRN